MFCNLIDSGIRSSIDIVIMTEEENARDDVIIVSLYFSFRKQGIIPIKVVKPAIRVIKKLYIMLFIVKDMELF